MATNQSCEYRFDTYFDLVIGMEYFDTCQYQDFVSGLLQIYIYIYNTFLIPYKIINSKQVKSNNTNNS
jgi:hypothetical protein